MDFFKKASASLGGGAGESDLMKQAQSFMGSDKSAATTHAPAATTPEALAAATTPPPAPPASAAGSAGYSEVYGSAQTLYHGLQDKMSGKQSTVDDHELASAASNVLKAAEKSGFAKDSQYGDYFNKAETYLNNYGQPKATGAPTSTPPTSTPPTSTPPPAQ